MATTIGRLLAARQGIELIDQYIKDQNFTQATFTNPKFGSEDYKTRAAILKEFEAVAENLNFAKDAPIRKKHLAFWKTASALYGMRSIIAHRYGVADIDYDKVWGALTYNIPNEILPTVKKLIEEDEEESKE